MDNMLYIIAGLVVILLVVGAVLFKKKAQTPPAQPHAKSGSKAINPAPKTDDGTATQGHEEKDNKFDPITIAQRFMDQQRYDKAIETLNRGLIETPNDSQLSLKLLSIYATTNQPEDFHKAYDTIQTQNDPKSIESANELKALFLEEYQVAVKETPVEETAGFESIDFDLSSNQDGDKSATSSEPIVEHNTDTLIDQPVDSSTASSATQDASAVMEEDTNSFDLTLSDLESTLDQPSSDSPVAPLPVADDADTQVLADVEDNDLSDFDFDFEPSVEEEKPESTETLDLLGDARSNDASAEAALDEDFVLDFDDLTTDINEDSNAINEQPTIDSVQATDDDFALSLEDLDESDDIEQVLDSTNPVLTADSDLDDFVLEDVTLEDSILKAHQLIDDEVDSSALELTDGTSSAPSILEDNALIDEGFDSLSDVPTVATPVVVDTDLIIEDPISITEQEPDTDTDTDTDTDETVEDFSSRFAADFDFVKSLDSNQVTLDLAAQYLQLGEYDSAKRLLNEVVTQGNSEQQSQAKVLLERTA